jgi:hypothetical protein
LRAIAVLLLALLLLTPSVAARTESREFLVGNGILGMEPPFGGEGYSLGGASFEIRPGEARIDLLVEAPTGRASFWVAFVDADQQAMGPSVFFCEAGSLAIPSGATAAIVVVGRSPFSLVPILGVPNPCGIEVPAAYGTVTATIR